MIWLRLETQISIIRNVWNLYVIFIPPKAKKIRECGILMRNIQIGNGGLLAQTAVIGSL